MKTVLLLFCVCVTAITCSPRRRFLDCEDFLCTDPVSPICGTNGVTYDSVCEMDMENKRRICWIGHFNMISKAKDGPCDATTTVGFE